MLLISACASSPPAETDSPAAPRQWTRPTPVPEWDPPPPATNDDLLQWAGQCRQALKSCNDDKAALRRSAGD